MSFLDDAAKVAETSMPLLLKYGPRIMPLLEMVDRGQVSEDALGKLIDLAMTMASDAQMRRELPP